MYTCYDKHLLLNSGNVYLLWKTLFVKLRNVLIVKTQEMYTCYDKHLLLNSRNVYLLW